MHAFLAEDLTLGTASPETYEIALLAAYAAFAAYLYGFLVNLWGWPFSLGADTQLPSRELTTESNFMVGNCENGYSCAYLNTLGVTALVQRGKTLFYIVLRTDERGTPPRHGPGGQLVFCGVGQSRCAPLVGFEVTPTRPTMREETVTKKNAKITTSSAASARPSGIPMVLNAAGTRASTRKTTSAPMPTVRSVRSCSVRSTVPSGTEPPSASTVVPASSVSPPLARAWSRAARKRGLP